MAARKGKKSKRKGPVVVRVNKRPAWIRKRGEVYYDPKHYPVKGSKKKITEYGQSYYARPRPRPCCSHKKKK